MIASILAVTWLNPLVYVEAVFLVGVLASTYGPNARLSFGAGFLAAFAVKLYGWSLAGVLFSSRFSQAAARRRFDAMSSLVIFAGLPAVDLVAAGP